MHLFYYDEVKYHPPEQDSFLLGGVCVEDYAVRELEERVSAISERVFGSRILKKETEFHGIEICGGKGNFKGVPFDDRLEILKELLDILSLEQIERIYVKIIPANITDTSKPPDEIAFMYLVEQLDAHFKSKTSIGMIFGDYDDSVIGSSVASLSQFRSGGTSWSRGKDIDHLIDTVHFAKSHHSRMIQLADVYLYCFQFLQGNNTAPWRAKIANLIDKSSIKNATRARVWPTERRWYR